MGLSFSCPLAAAYNREIEQHVVIEPVIVESISFGDDDKAKTPVRTISFMDRHSNPTIMGSGKMIQGSVVSFRAGDTQLMNLLNAPALSEQDLFITQTTSSDGKEINTRSPLRSDDSMTEKISQLPLLDSSNPKHEAAAIKLQKVYKSFRTRRKLADCAVLIEQSWWKLLDFAQLKHCSISFFDVEKHETAISRWSRARKRAAKVGKGLSKNAKAQKLALQHWLEAIDPRHRYGHNLHFYYVNWLHSQSNEPFFYWLDIGEGKEVNLFEKCCRSKLQQQCIKYLGPKERKVYKVVIEDGKLLYKQSGELLDSSKGSKGTKWIFVLSTSRTLYVGQKKKGTFQHSSFLAGGATLAAGRLVVENGILKAVWPHSGHYKPTPENFQDFLSFLEENCVDITDVKMDSVDEEQESVDKKFISHVRSNSSDEDLNEKLDYLEMEEEIDAKNLTLERSTSTAKETDDSLVRLKSENGAVESNSNTFWVESSLDGYNTAEESFDYSEQNDVKAAKQNLFDEEDRETFEETIILQRINSHKGMKSYQLGKQLSCKWSTGAGPRIGCLRDYPSGLQSHALEQANLSPRSAPSLRSSTSLSRVFTTTSFRGEIQEARSHILEDGLSTTLITATDN